MKLHILIFALRALGLRRPKPHATRRALRGKTSLFGCIGATALLLAACAGTVSQAPRVSREELALEQQEQDRIVREESAKKAPARAKGERSAMLNRLRAVGQPVVQAGERICRELPEHRNNSCTFPLALDKAEAVEVNAYTDGEKIVVSPAMMDFADSDDQLAVVISHEYAHAIMNHPGKTRQNASVGGLLGMAADILAQSQGINTGGTFGDLAAQGAVLRYSQGFEREADYIGMYILARAGYPVKEAARLWRRMATVNPEGVYNASTHPTSAERYVLLKKTATEIENKQAAGVPLLPERAPEE